MTDLAVYDGQTFFMPLYEGTGPDINITVNYNVVPDPPELILDINGTESNATITASIVGSAVFQSHNDYLNFFNPPNTSDVDVFVEGPLGNVNPWHFRGPADASYLNLLRISSGDFSTFTLDSSNPITSSNNFISGSVTDLAVYDGQTFFMP
ncbi:MAG: hypothetical protein GY893_13085, partial [bacterium]|nr:hypothetical protein [bacterium]